MGVWAARRRRRRREREGEGHYKVVLAIMVKKDKDDRHSRCLLCFCAPIGARRSPLRPVCVQVCDVVSVKNCTPCKMSWGVCVCELCPSR